MIILIHEIYGITKNLIKLKNYLEKNGFEVKLPNLYIDNYSGDNEKYSYNKFFSEVGIENAGIKIENIINENEKDEIILIGFSVGATIAWLESRNTKVKKIIGIYGTRIRKYLDVIPQVRTNLFFCYENEIDINQLITDLTKNTSVKTEIINGKHGFYSNEDFTSKNIKDINRKILRIVKKKDF